MDLSTLRSLPSGARFRRADLHIHSFGGSPEGDVLDTSMTPEAIVERAVAEGLEVIAITDHNSSGNVERALVAARRMGPILVIPAVEISTTDGHLLLYFATLASLDQALGKLTFSQDKKYCKQSFEDCLDIAKAHGGIGIAAHIESDASFMQRVPGNTPAKGGIIKHPALVALEILNSESVGIYTGGDPDAGRKQHAKERRDSLNVADDLPKTISSDAHSLAKLGKNAADAKRVTRLKMDELSFDAFRIALLEGSVRCRLEDIVPFKVPRVLGIAFEGGLLDGQAIRFNSNLTCIIGGRGSGKSTVLESLKVASGTRSGSGLLDSDAWSDTITLWHEDELGNVRQFVRQRGSTPYNPDDPFEVCHFPLEAYGQGETAETIQHCGDDPGLLLDFLDRLVNFDDANVRDDEAVAALETNAVDMSRLTAAVASLPRYKQLCLETDKKIKTLESQKAGEIIKLETALAQERSYYQELETLLVALKPPRTVELPEFLEYLRSIEEASVTVGKENLVELIQASAELEKDVTARHESWKAVVTAFMQRVQATLDAWKQKETVERGKIDAKRRELESQGMKLDMPYIRGLTKAKTDYDKKVRDLQANEKQLKELVASRKGLVASRRAIRAEVYAKRVAFAAKMTKSLLGDQEYRVTLRFREGAYSPGAEDVVTEAMGWRTSRVQRARLLVQQLSLPGILDALAARDGGAFAQVVDEQDTEVFNASDRALLHKTLGEADVRSRLEACKYDDLPDITVQKAIAVTSGQPKVNVRKFSKLSLGQQQAVVLSILLHSESTAPLIIDQPEDNLDGEFVARILVPHLRRVKECRQVVIATHNANIAVLADTELIIPLFAESDRTRIFKPGSIDVQDTRDQICRIVEGGKDSFLRRAKIYGVSS